MTNLTKQIVRLIDDKVRGIRHGETTPPTEYQPLEFEEQYTRSDKIFYRIKDSKIAVTRKLNHIDLSTLTPEETIFLFSSSDLDDGVEDRYQQIRLDLETWISNNSIISKIEREIDSFLIAESKLITLRKKLKDYELFVDTFVDKKLKFPRGMLADGISNSEAQVSEYLDLDIVDIYDEEDNFKLSKLLVSVTDNNVNIFRKKYEHIQSIVTAASFLSMLVNKYHERDRDNVTDATFEEYSNILRLITPASIGTDRGTSVDPIEITNSLNVSTYMNNIISPFKLVSNGNTYDGARSCMYMFNLFGEGKSEHYWYSHRYYTRSLYNRSVNLNIDYAAMSDEDLLSFKSLVDFLIDTHARYITKDTLEKEAGLLFLGIQYTLAGKKKTRDALNIHFKLDRMRTELERRGL